MFKKILIANRGEIALRIVSACKELGIATVAVYSEVDRNSMHVRFADEAVCVGPARNYESYLNVPSVISAAEITNVDAIHPGYGFLAESAYFAEVCETCHIKFIGPSPRVIDMVGEKARSREIMQQAGVPVLPGTGLLEKEFATAARLAQSIGYPLIIKASAGGGGRGMRIVRNEGDLARAFDSAQSEAASAFGSSRVYLERYLERPRHIEFQILADEHGNVIHLGERECSIQRRHQKLLEESPSVIMTPELRADIGAKVVEAIRKIGYTNAGTVEFLFDEEGNYYFIEMNTRIQVEHPITEIVTGFDIVKEQICIAAGEKRRYRQEDVHLQGHSLECRINAEDPISFAPCPGHISAFHPPGGPGVRVDTAAYTDGDISPHYDSLVAKVIVHGRDRAESLARMKRALEMFVIEGIKTSIPLHQKILSNPDFVRGKLSTGFVDDLRREY
ncbi:MAG: acetyl-CoA carboxylase biotin carboxylase subunit [Acidobacteria bacterium]|nr:acetyl-CoA carboxylase biotin carboxylase subunit [Acidobacteriota bacterium]